MTSLSQSSNAAVGLDFVAAPYALPEARATGEAEFLASPERVRREIDAMLGRQLSPSLSRWVSGYAKVGRRNPYLWHWCRQAVEATTLPCVPAELRDELCDTKTLGVVWDVMLDDVADQGGNPEMLETLLSWPLGRPIRDFSRFSPQEQAYAQFTCDVWEEIMRRAPHYPCFQEYASLLRFDYLQLSNVMRYSHLLNGNLNLLNLAEHDLYTPHNMHIMVCSTFDLMCSPKFDRTELGTLREIIWNAQCMGRIGNLVTTWQRELGEQDFTSGIYARTISLGDLTVEQLRRADRQEIEDVVLKRGHESYFLKRWQRHRQFLLSKKSQLRSFDVTALVSGFERLFCLHLGSRGKK